MTYRPIGTLRALHRYPVKSMAAESLSTAAVSWHGFPGDRRWAFLRPHAERSGFPWFTIREKPDLWLYRPRFADPTQVESSSVLVRTPTGAEFDVADPDLARQLGDGIRVIKQYSGIFDTFPLSVLTVQSVASLAHATGAPLTALRFRPNILIDSTDAHPFPEDAWCGAILRIGTLRLRLDKRDQRCMMVNVDPAHPQAAAHPAILRTIAQQRDACFGLYASTVEPGSLSLGDPVFLES